MMVRTQSTDKDEADTETVVGGPQVGEKAPDFLISSSHGLLSVRDLVARVGTLVLVSQDSYRYHGT